MEHKRDYKKIAAITILIILIIGVLSVFAFDVYRKNVVFNAPFEREENVTSEESGTVFIDESDDINGKFDNNASELINDTTTLPPTTLPPTTEATSETTTVPKPSLPSDVVSDDEVLLIKAINDYRKDNGLSELKTDKTLSDFAAIRAKEIENVWSANRPDGQPFKSIFSEYGIYESFKPVECVSKYKNFNTDSIIKAWSKTEQYKEILLNEKYDGVGVGVVYDANGNCYVSAIFINKD